MPSLDDMSSLPGKDEPGRAEMSPEIFASDEARNYDHDESRSTLSAPGLIVYRFFPSFADEEQLNEIEECLFCLWEACGQLGMNHPVPGQPFSEFLPVIPGRPEGAGGYGLTVIAARQSPRSRSGAPMAGGRVVLFEQDDVRGLALWLTASAQAGADALARLDSEEQVVLGAVGGLPDGYERGWLLGEARLFTGYVRSGDGEPVMPLVEEAVSSTQYNPRSSTRREATASRELMLPAGARSASWGGPYASIGDRILTSGHWEGPGTLRSIALATVASVEDLPRAEEELTRWAWQGNSGGMAPFASYALHASRLRREFNDYHGSRERAGERARLYFQRENANKEIDRLLALHAGEMRYDRPAEDADVKPSQRARSASRAEEPPVELLVEGHQRLSGLLMRSGGLVSAAMRAREVRQRVAAARRGMVEAVPEAIHAPVNNYLERDLSMAARLTSQIGADLAQVESAVSGSKEIFSLTDLRVRREAVKQERGRHSVSRMQGGLIVGFLGIAGAVIAFHLQLKAPAFIEWSIGMCVVVAAVFVPSAFARWLDGRRPSQLPGVTRHWHLPGDPEVASEWGLSQRRSLGSAFARALAAGLPGAAAFWLASSLVWWRTKGLVRGVPSHEGLVVMGSAGLLGALLVVVVTNPRVPRWGVRSKVKSEVRRRRKARARKLAERELFEGWDIRTPEEELAETGEGFLEPDTSDAGSDKVDDGEVEIDEVDHEEVDEDQIEDVVEVATEEGDQGRFETDDAAEVLLDAEAYEEAPHDVPGRVRSSRRRRWGGRKARSGSARGTDDETADEIATDGDAAAADAGAHPPEEPPGVSDDDRVPQRPSRRAGRARRKGGDIARPGRAEAERADQGPEVGEEADPLESTSSLDSEIAGSTDLDAGSLQGEDPVSMRRQQGAQRAPQRGQRVRGSRRLDADTSSRQGRTRPRHGRTRRGADVEEGGQVAGDLPTEMKDDDQVADDD